MSERETVEITVDKHSFKVKTYATARELHAIQQAALKGVKVGIKGEAPQISEIDPGVEYDMSVAMVEQLVVEMDGSTADIANRCQDLPSETWDELIQELDAKIAKKKK